MNTTDTIQWDFRFTGDLQPEKLEAEALLAREKLEGGSGAGSEFRGWIELPGSIEESLLGDLIETAAQMQNADDLVVIGIGGSYLGARAVLEALDSLGKKSLPIHFAGHHLDAAYHAKLLYMLRDSRYAVNVISKSGTTTEPGLAFRFFWKDLEARFGADNMHELIYVITDSSRGALKKLADSHQLKTFSIPDDIGGRYSVLTPVGLLPIAAAGFDIRELIRGAREMSERVRDPQNKKMHDNPALAYACYRNAAYRAGKKTEILTSMQPSLQLFAEWWKQLFGESEGKDHKGIFPAAVNYTSDLHSMGQWIQEGERTIFETTLDVRDGPSLTIPFRAENEDDLNYLSGKDLHEVNRIALQAVMKAHAEGDVPGARLEIPLMNERMLGGLIYMFEYACGISGYMLGVNPFDQPGVEAYKTAMFRLLGRPGF